MKKIISLLLIFSTYFIFGQKNIIGKEFTTQIGSICEETPEPTECSGSIDYLVLKFKIKYVEVIEKSIKCSKERIISTNNLKWNYEENIIHILVPTNIANESLFIKNMKLLMNNNELVGYKEDWQKKTKEYKFKKK